MSTEPVFIKEPDVALAWLRAFEEISKSRTDEIVPLVVCITGFKDNLVIENAGVRAFLDNALGPRQLVHPPLGPVREEALRSCRSKDASTRFCHR